MKFALRSSTVWSILGQLGISSSVVIAAATGLYEQLPPKWQGAATAMAPTGALILTATGLNGRSRQDIEPVTWRPEKAAAPPAPPAAQSLPAEPGPDIQTMPTPAIVQHAIQTDNSPEPKYPEPEYIDGVPADLIADLDQIAAVNETDDTEEELEIDLSILQGKYKVVALRDTKLKISPKDSAELEAAEWMNLRTGQTVEVDAWQLCQPANGHIEVVIDEYAEAAPRFFLFADHIELKNLLDKPLDLSPVAIEPKPVATPKTPLQLPGERVYLEDYILNPKGQPTHFTWAEATKNGQRIPESSAIVTNIRRQAAALDELRSHLGNIPIICTSWYRDPATNRAVGGASRSSHLTGSATDICSPAMDIRVLQSRVEQFWRKGGIGRGAGRGFVHVATDDWYRVWDY